jgi:signal transduction histidine kinase
MLDEDLGDHQSEARSSLGVTRTEVGRLAKLVSDFLTYARPSEPHFETLSVPTLLREVSEFLHAEATSMGVHLKVAADVPEVSVSGDEAQLRQVLLNLVLNAMQSVVGLSADRRVVELSAEVRDGRTALLVTDRGDGIPAIDLRRVREAFFTRRRGGSGLGLAIAERVAEVHGGSVVLENLEPVGFTAGVVLPTGGKAGKMSE